MTDILERIDAASRAARQALEQVHQGYVEAAFKAGDNPVATADLAVDAALRSVLPRSGEGWPTPYRRATSATDTPPRVMDARWTRSQNQLAAIPTSEKPRRCLGFSMVAGAGFEPATFGL